MIHGFTFHGKKTTHSSVSHTSPGLRSFFSDKQWAWTWPCGTTGPLGTFISLTLSASIHKGGDETWLHGLHPKTLLQYWHSTFLVPILSERKNHLSYGRVTAKDEFRTMISHHLSPLKHTDILPHFAPQWNLRICLHCCTLFVEEWPCIQPLRPTEGKH